MVILPIIFLLLSRHFHAFWSVPSVSFFPSLASFLPITVLITSSPCSSFGLHQFTIIFLSCDQHHLLFSIITIIFISIISSYLHHPHIFFLCFILAYLYCYCECLHPRVKISESGDCTVPSSFLSLPEPSPASTLHFSCCYADCFCLALMFDVVVLAVVIVVVVQLLKPLLQ